MFSRQLLTTLVLLLLSVCTLTAQNLPTAQPQNTPSTQPQTAPNVQGTPSLLSAPQNLPKLKPVDNIWGKDDGSKFVTVRNVGRLNSTRLEFSPAFYKNGLVYVSSKNKNGRVDRKIKETFFELMFADLDATSGTPLKMKPFSLELNSQFHEGPVSFSKDGSMIYFTRSNETNGVNHADKQGVTRLKIYSAMKEAEDWAKIKELPFNNNAYSVCHPALSPDGTKLYFASDMPGGAGGMDLYMVERFGEIWSEPVNLINLNTAKNEAFPFMHESGTLFFASDGYAGVGGMDMYAADLKTNRVFNLGEPFNSAKDDLGLILSPDAKRGYFSSNRVGGIGKDDIYMFDMQPVASIVPTLSAGDLAGVVTVTDGTTGAKIAGAGLHFFELNPNGFTLKEDLYDVVLSPSQNSTSELTIKFVRKKNIELRAPDRYTNPAGEAKFLFKKDKQYLVVVTKKDYESLEILQSTIGKDKEYTAAFQLKPQRCAKVRGILSDEKSNIVLADVAVKIQSLCNAEKRDLRTDAKGEYEACLPIGCDFSISYEKDGFTAKTEKFSTVGVIAEKETVSAIKLATVAKAIPVVNVVEKTTIFNTPLEKGATIVLDKIYYDYGNYNISTGAATELDQLATVMQQHASMEIDLGAHTDCRGTTEFNLELSQKRADAAKVYLVNKGIAIGRIRATGYGESIIRNQCKDGVQCSDTEHQYNRRTEVRVVKVDTTVQVQYKN
jgi:outer membrane protein OmpA-like peptidoglycan-associated protein